MASISPRKTCVRFRNVVLELASNFVATEKSKIEKVSLIIIILLLGEIEGAAEGGVILSMTVGLLVMVP